MEYQLDYRNCILPPKYFAQLGIEDGIGYIAFDAYTSEKVIWRFDREITVSRISVACFRFSGRVAVEVPGGVLDLSCAKRSAKTVGSFVRFDFDIQPVLFDEFYIKRLVMSDNDTATDDFNLIYVSVEAQEKAIVFGQVNHITRIR